MLTRPRRLRPGDRLAVVSPSWGGPGAIPHRFEVGRRQLEAAFDVELRPMPHALADAAWVAANPAARADDLHAAFVDPDIAGVVASIGGDDAIRILPHLDLALLAAHPKAFLGYSDATIVHMALRSAGLTSFYGPSVMAGFAENGGLHGYLVEGVYRALFEPEVPHVWHENRAGWTVERLEWADPSLQERRRALQPSTGWRWHGGRVAEGPTLVACVEVLDWLRGTRWWPSLDGVMLLLETSEEAPPPVLLSRFLRVLAATGELRRIAGLVLGRPGGATLPVEEHEAYDRAVLTAVRLEAGLRDLPIVANVDFGHTDPIWTIPQGVALRVDPTARRLTFLEAGVV